MQRPSLDGLRVSLATLTLLALPAAAQHTAGARPDLAAAGTPGGSIQALTPGGPVDPAPVHGVLSLGVRDDAFEPVPYPVAYLSQGGLIHPYLGDVDGQSDGVVLQLDAPIGVRIEEAVTTARGGQFAALTIGQAFTYRPMDPGESFDGLRLYYQQPKAREIHFTGTAPVSDFESGWLAAPWNPMTPPDFTAWAAELPTDAVISNYVEYQTGLPDMRWMHGLLLRVTQDVDLTAAPLVIAIDRNGYEYSDSGPHVRAVHAGTAPDATEFSAALLTVDDDWLQVLVSGVLRAGDNLVLVRKTADVEGPVLPPGDGGVITFPSTTLNGECEPAAPVCTTAETCTPESTGECWGYDCWDETLVLGNVVCADCGSSRTKEKCSEFKGGLSASIKWKLFGGELSVTAAGEIRGKACSGVTAEAGHCALGYNCYKVCKHTCKHTVMIQHMDGPSDHYYDKDHSCLVEGKEKSSACKHTDCT